MTNSRDSRHRSNWVLLAIVALALIALGLWSAHNRMIGAETHAIVDIVSSWGSHPPPGVGEREWDEACQWVVRAVLNVLATPAATLQEIREVRAEVERLNEAPVTPVDLERLWHRLGQAEPHGPRYVWMMDSSWRDAFNAVRAGAAGSDVDAAFRAVRALRDMRPAGTHSGDWFTVVFALETALVQIYADPEDVMVDARRRLRIEVEELLAKPVTAETLQRLVEYLSEATPRGADYMRKVGYLRNDLDRLNRRQDAAELLEGGEPDGE
jgi:hypothetical protein